MLIGILSDSHNNHTNLLYALDIFRTLGVRILMHAGDLTLDVMLEDFKDFDLYLAFGNGDDPEMITIRARKISKRFVCGETLDLCLENRKIFAVSYTHLRAHETPEHLVCRLLLEKKKKDEQHISYHDKS